MELAVSIRVVYEFMENKVAKLLKNFSNLQLNVLSPQELVKVTGGSTAFYWVCCDGSTGQGNHYDSSMCNGCLADLWVVQQE